MLLDPMSKILMMQKQLRGEPFLRPSLLPKKEEEEDEKDTDALKQEIIPKGKNRLQIKTEHLELAHGSFDPDDPNQKVFFFLSPFISLMHCGVVL